MRGFRAGWLVGLAAMATTAFAANPHVPSVLGTKSRILLVPLDDRPATSHFAEMIGAIGNVEIVTPPKNMLGQFTTPGDPDAILAWMQAQDLRQYSSIIVNTEMIAYGGLIASRTTDTAPSVAMRRLDRLHSLRNQAYGVPFYGFTSIMRLAPTSTIESRSYRDILTKAVVWQSRFERTAEFDAMLNTGSTVLRTPEPIWTQYFTARDRNLAIQRELIKMSARGIFDFLVVGLDDAQPESPQVSERRALMAMADRLGVRKNVFFCEGVDQNSNVLLSRAVLSKVGWKPKVRVVYADNNGVDITPPYETQPLARTVTDQIVASGGEVVGTFANADYTLYINTPNPRPESFQQFTDSMENELQMGFPIAVADINLGKSGTGDPNLFAALATNDRAFKLLGYAGWNTAGNTLGTTIPTANMVLAARRVSSDALTRETSLREFLLHRLVNDFQYHRFTRPKAYEFIDQNPPATREEVYGEQLSALNHLVRTDLSDRLNEVFRTQFSGKRFFAGSREYEIIGLEDVDVNLPWPRAYEVRLGFKLVTREVAR